MDVDFRFLKNLDLRAIAAMAKNRVIGNNNSLPWNIPEELEFFRKTTQNSSILMGRKTFESIGRPLPKRTNIVLTGNPDWQHDGVIAIRQLDELLNLKVPYPIWVCGGATLYRQLLPVCRELYLSIILEDVEGDVRFPYFETKFIKNSKILTCSKFETFHFLNKDFIGQ